MPRAIRTIVADDHPAIASALVSALEADPRFTVVGTAASGTEAERLVRAVCPDVVLLDVHMPGGGAHAARTIASLAKPPLVVAVSAHSSLTVVEEMLGAGVGGYLTKGRIGQLLPDLLIRCLRGEVVLV
jgi:DNA-binding NarL/FixJ family response regulator